MIVHQSGDFYVVKSAANIINSKYAIVLGGHGRVQTLQKSVQAFALGPKKPNEPGRKILSQKGDRALFKLAAKTRYVRSRIVNSRVPPLALGTFTVKPFLGR